jgi:hypothetical protein
VWGSCLYAGLDVAPSKFGAEDVLLVERFALDAFIVTRWNVRNRKKLEPWRGFFTLVLVCLQRRLPALHRAVPGKLTTTAPNTCGRLGRAHAVVAGAMRACSLADGGRERSQNAVRHAVRGRNRLDAGYGGG